MSTNTLLDSTEVQRILFHPEKQARSPLPAGAMDLDIEVDDNVTLGCRLFVSEPAAPLILFFHGNGETVADYDEIGPNYARFGLNFLVTDYRGYGWSGGSPSARAMLEDAEALFSHVTSTLVAQGFTGPLFLMGRSLGSACAIDLAARHNQEIKGLLIESGFAESLPVARRLGLDLPALGVSEEECFNNERKIATITKPTFIVHGQFDSLIDFIQAEKLQAASGAHNKELQMVPGAGHNDLIAKTGPLYFQVISQFISKVSGSVDWRKRRKQYHEERLASHQSDKKGA